jgi:branched-subunit amino acid aminotransferase/4-amino-4-deoxychorismate lyase
VTAVERLRTYAGRIFALDAHLERWQHSTGELGITPLPSPAITKVCLQTLIAENHALVRSEGDIGITMFATPGEIGSDAPTFGMHLNRLDHARILRRCQYGQPLVVTEVRQPDPDCWPRTIKVRSRIHYYRADTIARQHHEDAAGVLVDDDNSITETSIANLAIVKSGQIVSPPTDRVLGGITQSVIERLASDASIEWIKNPISIAQLQQADEVLLMGTDGGVWFAGAVDGDPIAQGNPGDIYRMLRERLDALVQQVTP